ncbi:uncharacterized protein LOC120258675 [Dioscorea cayenensis subsp. rotundata]|uniref:Uncharacterized protein LOC120258675 n=1 Tax=Dioscorea cayennensis subsp. rotundata TaxID=55577 RepID=A0AB40B5K7_DIOCR|nr:uncharacterized protein LOC120258675 [Dioscorea cayenensis subsp. rotundata]
MKEAQKKRKYQLNELEKYRLNAYENTLLYKEKMRRMHDDHLRKEKQFQIGEQVLLFNSRLKLFSGKLKSCWLSPYTVTQTFPHGAIEIFHPTKGKFKVSGHRLKHYEIREGVPHSTNCGAVLLHEPPG